MNVNIKRDIQLRFRNEEGLTYFVENKNITI